MSRGLDVTFTVVKISVLSFIACTHKPVITLQYCGRFDRTLGGHAMEIRMRDHLIKLFKEKYKTQGEVTESPRAMAKFLKEAARVKQVLSANTEIFAQVSKHFYRKFSTSDI